MELFISDFKYTATELLQWFKPSIRRLYLEKYGRKQMVYDFLTIIRQWIVGIIWFILYIPVGALFLVALLIVWVIENGSEYISRKTRSPWSKRAYFKSKYKEAEHDY